MGHTLSLDRACVGDLVAAQADERPHTIALHATDGPPLTYAALQREVTAIGARVRAAGVGPRDRVAVVLPNGPAMAVAFLGVASVAACAPLNPGYTAAEFEFYLSDLDARAIIVPAGVDTPARGVAATRGVAVMDLSRSDTGAFTLDGADGSAVPALTTAPGDVALVLHTSGTTSRPKIIPLTHANLCASADTIRATLDLGEDDRVLNVMPLFHIHGLVGALLSSLAAGGSVVCTPGFSPVHFFRWLDDFTPTWYSAVPTMHQEVLARAIAHPDSVARSRLRFIRSASSPLPAAVMAGLERVFAVPVIEAYGMTEAAHQIASNPLPPGARKPGSVGRPTGCDVAILDEAGRPQAVGEQGEIAIRGANVTTMGAAPAGDEARWLRTGDVGYIDAEGYVFIAGRIKEIINRAGEKIAPREVDEVLLKHPAVAQAVAFGVPDARLGEDVIAVVVRRPGGDVSERELREFAARHLAAFKVPRRVKFLEQIPTGATGKLQRIGLAATLGIDADTLSRPTKRTQFRSPVTPTESALAAVWGQVLAIDGVSLDDNFFELGGDSLAAMEVVAAVDARLGVDVTIRDLAFGTLQQVAAACDEAAVNASSHGPARESSERWLRRLWKRWRQP